MDEILYGFYNSSFGQMVIAKTPRGLCWLGFMVDGYKGDGFTRMKDHFKDYSLIRDDAAIKLAGDEIMDAWAQGREKEIAVDLHGTDFQKSVWTALLSISKGSRCSYSAIANDIGKPRAVRAVGTAVGENPVSLIIPCHRVVRADGGLGNYGWGVDLKAQILDAEAA